MEGETGDNSVSQKRKNNEENLSEIHSKAKKPRLYSVKEFRKQLGSNEKLQALKEFLSVIKNSAGHDYVYDYLKNGGSCLELLQTLENDSAIPPTVIFDLVTQLLLKITASYGQYYNAAHESCKYLLNNYLPLLHKMLGLSSSKEERKACLKLLTAIAAFSPNLARDILVNVKFHSANTELLTKHTGEKNSVRDCFVHFLTAFLVDSDLHTLSILLEKSGLLTSIISGLQYDVADTVCVVIAAMKNHILENNAVMKTTKMHVFNTSVVKDIVNLYNWKGPVGLKALEKNNKTVFEIDKIAKSKVSECVHDFLLVLCTSHKHGVIFRDPLVGLGKRNQNGLMYTVLDSLDRPWEHSYASELVIKICKACPDLTKNLWAILKPFLEPRLTEKWLNAMDFARKLIKVMEPHCIEYCARELSPQQLAQIIEFLVSPSPILKIILSPENNTNDNSELTQHILLLLNDMLDKIDTYLQSVKKWTNIDNFTRLNQFLANYIARNYPYAQKLFENWKILYSEEKTEDRQPENDRRIHLEIILSIVSHYKTLAPQLLRNLTSGSLDLKELLLKLTILPDDEGVKFETLQMKIISIFVDVDHSYFLPESEIFGYVVPLLLKIYHRERSKEIQMVLNRILKNAGIFDGSLYEINIWVNGIFNFNVLTERFTESFIEIIKETSKNVLEYHEELARINVEDHDQETELDLTDTLLNIAETSEDESVRRIKHNHLSPVIVGFLKYLRGNEPTKNLKKYTEFVLLNLFHCQTTLSAFHGIVENYRDHVPSNILDYVQRWIQGDSEPVTKIKGNLDVFKKLSEAFLIGSIDEELLNEPSYPDFQIDLLRMYTFYFSNLVSRGSVSEIHLKNWIFLIEFLAKQDCIDDRCLEIVLENPNLISHFSITQYGKTSSSGICTSAIIEVLEFLVKTYNIKSYTRIYSSSVFSSVVKILKKPKKYLHNENITKILEICPLGYKDCIKVITQISELLSDNFDLTQNSTVLDILTYCLKRVLYFSKEDSDLQPLEGELIKKITSLLTRFNIENRISDSLLNVVKNYLEIFPHCLSYIDPDLFSSILRINEYNKDAAELAVLLLEKNLELAKEIQANIGTVVEKKGLVLPLVHVLVNSHTSEDTLKPIYEKLETSILKAMQKPQKVGQHFLKNYNIGPLIGTFMPFETCKTFTEKVQKFEVTELFHVKLLEACFGRVLSEEEISEKQINSIVLTLIHLELTLLKKKANPDEDLVKINEISNVFNGILLKLISETSNRNLSQIANSETFKTFCKFALKYGVSGQHILLEVLRNLIVLLSDSLKKEEAGLLLEMLTSHSEFLNVVLGESSDTKLGVLLLFLTIGKNWSEFLEKSHVAVILSAYRGMVTKCDRIVLQLLKLYELKAEQTRFYDFKPFLWGRAAATHYSVRAQIESSLIRQPKLSDVLGILKEDLINSTITNYPLKESLHQGSELPVKDFQCYDLKFLLPLFSHILAPEQQVRTYIFTRRGGLSLTVIGLSSQDKEVRQAACHVLSRFHFHLEARQTGKDNLLWIRFVEALCKGAAVLPDFKLNNFAAIFYARMALILTNPKHVMYTPLSSYLTAKQDLDLSTVPELYTLLFSSDVNFKEHRNFILEILRDGLRKEKDFVDFLKSMAFKLFSELFSSCLSDIDSKLLILDILLAAVKLPLGVKVLCENYSLLAHLHTLAGKIVAEAKVRIAVLPKLLQIFLEIVKIRRDHYTNQLVFDIFLEVLKSDSFLHLKECDINCFYEVLYTVFINSSILFKDKNLFLGVLLERANDKFCNYIRDYGCKFISETSSSFQLKDKHYFLRLLVFKLLL